MSRARYAKAAVEDDPWLTVEQAMEYTHRARQTLYNAKGALSTKKDIKRVYFRKSELREHFNLPY